MNDKLIEIVSSVLGISESEVNCSLSPKNNSCWDSFKSIEIILSLEEHFNIKFSSSDLDKIVDIRSLTNVMRVKGIY